MSLNVLHDKKSKSPIMLLFKDFNLIVEIKLSVNDARKLCQDLFNNIKLIKRE